MSLKVGIVGLPNVGKSTLFNALLKRQQAVAANYPFATIEPNVGVVAVPDERLKELQNVVEKNFNVKPPLVPAMIEMVDIAGIVAGAHKGEGLGNQFLANIREVDLIAHVVRDFADADVVKTGKSLEDDYLTIIAELILKDLETAENQLIKLKKDRSVEGKTKMAVIEELLEGFNANKRVVEILTEEQQLVIKDLFLLTSKTQVVVVNVDENRLVESEKIRGEVALKLGLKKTSVVVVSAKIESELAVLDEDEAKIFMDDLGISESGLERLAKTAYGQLGLISFLTAGEKEVRAWTVTKGSLAPQAAGVIHSDFEKKFIKAEVVDVAEFVEWGGWKNCREKGKVRLEGREYEIVDGDVVDFKIGS